MDKKKDNERHRQVYAENKLKANTGYNSKKAEHNASSRVRRCLPTDPEKYAAVVNKAYYDCTPRKRRALDSSTPITARKKLLLLDDFSNECLLIRKCIAARIVKARKTSKRQICKVLRLGRNTRLQRKKRNRRSTINVAQVHTFYMREDISDYYDYLPLV